MSGGTVRIVAVSPILPHLLAWLETDTETRHGQQDAFLAGWEACERANNLPAARLAAEVDDGR